MTDWNTLLQSDEFKAYRKKQVECIGVFVESQMRKVFNGGLTSDSFAMMNGSIAMARMLVELPEKLTNDKGVQENLQVQKKEDLAALSSFLVRRQMLGE